MVKQHLTVNIANEGMFDASSDRALRKSPLFHNALGRCVTRVAQRSVFC